MATTRIKVAVMETKGKDSPNFRVLCVLHTFMGETDEMWSEYMTEEEAMRVCANLGESVKMAGELIMGEGDRMITQLIERPVPITYEDLLKE